MLRVSKSRGYSVRAVGYALDILEVLQAKKTPLRSKEVAGLAKTPLSSTYRILQTFLERGYVTRHLDGRFSIKSAHSNTFVRHPSLLTRAQNTGLHGDTVSNSDILVDLILALINTLRPAGHSNPAVDVNSANRPDC